MKIRGVFCLIMPAFVFAGLVSCGKKISADPPNPELVAAFSGGVVDRHGPIIVQFTRDFDSSVSVPQNTFRLDPSTKGTVSWENSYTLQFFPDQPLKPGTTYTAYVNPVPLTMLPSQTEVEIDTKLILPELKPFSFSFSTSVPTLELILDPVRINADDKVLVSGLLITEMSAGNSKVEKTLQARELGKVSWTHENDEHRFSFDPVSKDEKQRTVTLAWDGNPIGVEDKGSVPVVIPGRVFEVVEIRFVNGVLEVTFSASLQANQNLRGFISLSGNTDVRYSLEGNIVRIYGEQGKSGGIAEGAVLIIQDLPDAYGNVLVQQVQYTVPGKWELPEVRFAGRGTILPSSQGSQMVIETKNLSGILVEAFKIHGDNMIQFLQVNSLEGIRELERVGEPVWTKSFDLSWKESDKNNWKRHGLDLSDLAKKYPDGMFHIRLSFRPRHTKYECRDEHADFSTLEFPPDFFPDAGSSTEESYWDYWEGRYDNNWYRYRMDPCHPAFYLNYYDHNVIVGRNVLVSDLALMAKRGLDGSWIASASNVKTAQPENGVSIEVLNFQGRSLYKIRTDSSGIASFSGAAVEGDVNGRNIPAPGNHVPAFLFASGSPGRSWLKIGESQALTVSHFDIAGGRPASGLRGLIYGERGVWRPGDDIFLTFLLSDPEKTLPANHPVSFELEDPRGRISGQKTFTSSVDGFYSIAASTSIDAPTGDWIARVKVGGSTFTRNLKIETVIPNRLKIDLDFGSRNYIEKEQSVGLEAAWLYGAPAPNLNADVSVTFTEKTGVFPANGDYSFTDPSRAVSGERQRVWDGRLDGEGRARFSLALDPGAVPGKLNARFMTRVFEPSGAFSSEQMTQEFSPYKRYVGLRLPKGDAARNMLLTDVNHKADILLLDPDGKPINGRIELDCALYKLEWRWWWEKGEYEAAEFASIQSRKPIMNGTAVVQNGRGNWEFQVKYPDWGRYMVVARDKDGHSASSVVYIDWPGWAGRATEGAGQGAAAMLVLSPDKSQYRSGEKASVSFPSNKEAGALVVIEKGGNVIKREWIRCQDTLTRYEFTAEASMVPNVYVHITLVQPHLQTQNDLPLRLYGVTPIMVEDPRTLLTPVITAGENWEPEAEASFTVSEASGRPMTYTVAVVDEGLLGLTRFSLPNPRNTFYAKEASFLKSWDHYADFMGAYSGRLETLLAIGGGDDELADGNKETQRFKPVVRYFGPYELKAGEKKTERFALPPYIGALRIMVLAASSSAESGGKTNRAYGTAEKQVKVSSDLMVFGTLPRVISPGDEAIIPVSVALYKPGSRNVEVSMTVQGAVLQGRGNQSVSFTAAGEKTIPFTIRAPNSPGIVRFTITASSPSLKNARHITDLEVRSTALPVTTAQLKLISPNETWTGTIAYPGMNGTNEAVLELSRLPPINLEGRLNHLINYPHGCIEQTTSTVFPQLYLDKVLDMSAARVNEIRSNVRAGIERLGTFQVPDGGFAYWPGGESADDWASSYAGHFLIEAKRSGYTVPQGLLNGFINFQKNRAVLWASRDGNQAEQAYRLYTLALAGDADLGSMNRLRERQGLDPLARWRLAAAYWYAGQRDTARNLANGLGITVAPYREYGQTFGSAFRDKAIILETLVLLGGSEADAKSLFEQAANTLSSGDWLSTQETANALRAAMLYMQGSQGSSRNGELRAEYSFGSGNGKNNVSFNSQTTQVSLGNPSGTSGVFSVKNNSVSPVYARIAVRGLPEEGKEQPLSNGLSLTVEYRTESGAINPTALSPGNDMTIRVTVTNTRRVKVENIALVHQLPASWEIVNDRIGAEGRSPSSFDYQDIRDDRVMTYFGLEPGASKIVSIRINNTYGGTYFRPAIHAYAMYDESVAALIPGVR
ncbi:MAG: MG2 domain-containing protein [Treponema sp.]|nr:MG2 domain-containing protein [Treponema sp.]